MASIRSSRSVSGSFPFQSRNSGFCGNGALFVAQYGSWAVVVGEVFGFSGSLNDLLLCRRSVEVDAVFYL